MFTWSRTLKLLLEVLQGLLSHCLWSFTSSVIWGLNLSLYVSTEEVITRGSICGLHLKIWTFSYLQRNLMSEPATEYQDLLFVWGLWYINTCRLFNAISRLYIYTKYIWLKKHYQDNIFKQRELIFTTQLNGFKNFYLTQIILLTINHLLAHS